MNNDEQWFIRRVLSKDISEADLYSCIETLEMLLSLDSLPALVELLADSKKPIGVRERAATAIQKLGVGYAEPQLQQIKAAASPEILRLIKIALNDDKF